MVLTDKTLTIPGGFMQALPADVDIEKHSQWILGNGVCSSRSTVSKKEGLHGVIWTL